MKRRHLFGITAASAAGLGTGSAQAESPDAVSSPGKPAIRWRMATSWPKSLDIVFGSVNLLCQRVSEMTGGRFVITPYEADELAPALGVMDAVADGTVDCGHTASYYYVDRSLTIAFGTTVPFGLNAQQHLAWLLEGGGLDLLQGIYADFGLIQFPMGSTGAQMGGWFRRHIETPADLQGLRMRIPGLGGKVLARLGVDVQVLSGTEIFTSLEQDLIDAAEWVGPYEDEKLGLNRVAPYYYYPGWWEPGTTYELQINRAAWDQLPQAYQEALRGAALEAHMTMLAKYDSANGAALERLMIGGTQLFAYSPSILTEVRKTAIEFYEEEAAADPAFQALYTAWKQFRAAVYGWNRLGSLALAEAIAPPGNA